MRQEMAAAGVGVSRLLALLLLSLLGLARSDFSSDQAECSSQLMTLATCLTYVQGKAPAPTPDCCDGVRQVVANSFKCLCVLIKDRNEPELGLKFEVALALKLPATCHSPANFSDCPRKLNLPPNSQAAKDFEQFGKATDKQAPAGSGNSSDVATGSKPGGASAGSGHNVSSDAGTYTWHLGANAVLAIWSFSLVLPTSSSSIRRLVRVNALTTAI